MGRTKDEEALRCREYRAKKAQAEASLSKVRAVCGPLICSRFGVGVRDALRERGVPSGENKKKGTDKKQLFLLPTPGVGCRV